MSRLLRLVALVAILTLPVLANAQATPTAVTAPQTFTLDAAPIALPGNHATFVGSISGVQLAVTRNLSLREDNLVATSGNLTAFTGGVSYNLPVLSTALNNVSPNLNGYRFQFYLTGSVGVDRITPQGSTTTAQHYAFLAGGGVRYSLSNSGTWSLGAEVRWARLPGMANNTVVVSAGPSLHF